jgi:hypothetical protein
MLYKCSVSQYQHSFSTTLCGRANFIDMTPMQRPYTWRWCVAVTILKFLIISVFNLCFIQQDCGACPWAEMYEQCVCSPFLAAQWAWNSRESTSQGRSVRHKVSARDQITCMTDSCWQPRDHTSHSIRTGIEHRRMTVFLAQPRSPITFSLMWLPCVNQPLTLKWWHERKGKSRATMVSFPFSLFLFSNKMRGECWEIVCMSRSEIRIVFQTFLFVYISCVVRFHCHICIYVTIYLG